MVLTTGNEGNAAHHFSGYVPEGEESYETVEIRVGEGEQGFLMEMWGKVPDTLFASIRTPGGEVVPRFRLTAEGSQTFSFIYERTRIIIDSILVEPNTGEELIAFRFDAPTPGVWNIRVYNLGPDRSRQFHLAVFTEGNLLFTAGPLHHSDGPVHDLTCCHGFFL